MKKAWKVLVVLAAVGVFLFNGYKLIEYLIFADRSIEVNERIAQEAVALNPDFFIPEPEEETGGPLPDEPETTPAEEEAETAETSAASAEPDREPLETEAETERKKEKKKALAPLTVDF